MLFILMNGRVLLDKSVEIPGSPEVHIKYHNSCKSCIDYICVGAADVL